MKTRLVFVLGLAQLASVVALVALAFPLPTWKIVAIVALSLTNIAIEAQLEKASFP